MHPHVHAAEEVVTNFGNITVAGPLALLLLAWLWWAGARRLALVIGGSVAGALSVAVVLRSISRATGGELAGTPFHLTIGAPSGHATTSTIVYGALAVLFAVGARGTLRWAAIGTSVLVVAGVAVTRVTLHKHSPADVAAGLLLGALCAIPVVLIARREHQDLPAMAPLLLVLAAAATALQCSGLRFDSVGVL